MRALAASALALIVALAAACSDEAPPCYAKDKVACSCGAGTRGYATCRDDEQGYSPCACEAPSDAGAADAPGGG
jgi:hypothetical protein